MEKKIRIDLNSILTNDELGDEGDMVPIISDGDDAEINIDGLPETLPLLPLRNNVLFPGVVLPISIGRPKSVQLIRDAYRSDKYIATFSQKDPDIEEPAPGDLHSTGTVGQIVKLLEMPDGSTTAIIQGRTKIDRKSVV